MMPFVKIRSNLILLGEERSFWVIFAWWIFCLLVFVVGILRTFHYWFFALLILFRGMCHLCLVYTCMDVVELMSLKKFLLIKKKKEYARATILMFPSTTASSAPLALICFFIL